MPKPSESLESFDKSYTKQKNYSPENYDESRELIKQFIKNNLDENNKQVIEKQSENSTLDKTLPKRLIS